MPCFYFNKYIFLHQIIFTIPTPLQSCIIFHGLQHFCDSRVSSTSNILSRSVLPLEGCQNYCYRKASLEHIHSSQPPKYGYIHYWRHRLIDSTHCKEYIKNTKVSVPTLTNNVNNEFMTNNNFLLINISSSTYWFIKQYYLNYFYRNKKIFFMKLWGF